ncbi:respiratory nitrate reductase subunit gamma [Amycolatopsis cihanbeyliensis]|uniref:Nitrate reductase-like protein NarX n=1 Tax=Amycolatopsis cihanbeyliensis TaxID=1128664 RepID=A0A542DKH4_AMYCI|nr:respiratory nitrate reductase subunit gamma [Amycolatopsis cihanbeyliensis]TQJ03573.1 respiratory nitrate reductase gamma subunit [Amycolatopsis cihanbeyliensis]
MSGPVPLLLWVVLPYLTLLTFVGGTIWRYRHDRFGWTTRSSQLHESRLLRIASPLFHAGLFLVIGGHILGLVVPKGVTEFLGITATNYRLVSLTLGTLAGAATATGLVVLLWRRLRVVAVRKATSGNDIAVYLLLGLAVLTGLLATVVDNGLRGGYDYRETVAPWFRGIFLLQPRPGPMAQAPLDYQLHTLFGMALFALWPFSRLVHAFSAPVRYLVRPYIVYRGRAGDRIGTRRPHRGWRR